MKVSVEKKRCNGCTICNITCPEVFAIESDGKAEARMTEVPKAVEQICMEAADECPMRAIVLEYDARKAGREIPAFAELTAK